MKVDWHAADIASDRIVAAYEIGDIMSDYAEEHGEAEAIAVAQIVIAFALAMNDAPEKRAAADFARPSQKNA